MESKLKTMTHVRTWHVRTVQSRAKNTHEFHSLRDAQSHAPFHPEGPEQSQTQYLNQFRSFVFTCNSKVEAKHNKPPMILFSVLKLNLLWQQKNK